MELHLDWIGVQVYSLSESIAFYRDALGLRLTHRSDDVAILKTPAGIKIELFTGGLRSSEPRLWAGVNARVPGFEVRDLPSAVEQLKARGLNFVTPIEVEGWGRFAYFVDPDGNQWQLHENGHFKETA
jgi:predicted enzyme related to lactoylglutathione lyase